MYLLKYLIISNFSYFSNIKHISQLSSCIFFYWWKLNLRNFKFSNRAHENNTTIHINWLIEALADFFICTWKNLVVQIVRKSYLGSPDLRIQKLVAKNYPFSLLSAVNKIFDNLRSLRTLQIMGFLMTLRNVTAFNMVSRLFVGPLTLVAERIDKL